LSFGMEHFDIADMFGRRRKPVLALELRKDRHGSQLIVLVKNVGRGTAKAPYLAIGLPRQWRASDHGVDGHGRYGLQPLGESDGICRFGASADAVIHPGQHLPVAVLECTVQQPSGIPVLSGPQVFPFELAAEDTEMTTGEIRLDY
jgi:hypothetical protein